MYYADKTSREVWLEYQIECMSYGRDSKEGRRLKQEAAFGLYEKISIEYKRGETPRYVMELEERLKNGRNIYGYSACIMFAVHSNVLGMESEKSIKAYLDKKAAPIMYDTNYILNNEERQELWQWLQSLENKYAVSESYIKSPTAIFVGRNKINKELQTLEARREALQREIRRLEEQKIQKEGEKTSLEAQIAELQKQRGKLQETIAEETRREKERAWEQMDQELAQERGEKRQALAEEYEAKRQEYMEGIKAGAAYKERRRELEELMASTEVLYKKQEEKKSTLLQEMADIKLEFKRHKEAMEEKLRLISEEVTACYQSATNQVVNAERQLQQDKMQRFIDNCGELQRMLYYQKSEEELGLNPTRVESYLNRFMRVLREFGYESIMPEIGEKFDPYKHEEMDPRDGEQARIYPEEAQNPVVKEVVSCAFRKIDEDDDYVKKAEVVVGEGV